MTNAKKKIHKSYQTSLEIAFGIYRCLLVNHGNRFFCISQVSLFFFFHIFTFPLQKKRNVSQHVKSIHWLWGTFAVLPACTQLAVHENTFTFYHSVSKLVLCYPIFEPSQTLSFSTYVSCAGFWSALFFFLQ